MASFTSRAVRSILEPVLKKHGIDLPPLEAPAKSLFGLNGDTLRGLMKGQRHKKGNDMGALLRFILINAASVIGAKLMSEASDRISQRLFREKSAAVADDPAHPDAPTLDTRVCPKCGAFRIRGEQCACGAK